MKRVRNVFRVHREWGRRPGGSARVGIGARPSETREEGDRAGRTGDPERGRAGRAGPWVDPRCWAGVRSGVQAPGSARTGLPGMGPP